MAVGLERMEKSQSHYNVAADGIHPMTAAFRMALDRHHRWRPLRTQVSTRACRLLKQIRSWRSCAD
ncbi:hypothetical protein BD309DRAFT_950012 [Dichomitus squalens]|nr:hypothetical protein BD309DRAFT_950012 [Dichomitus squalens]